MKAAIAEVVATSFYAGYVPKAPGTAGALAGVLLVYLLHHFTYFTSYHVGIFAVVLVWPAIWASNVLIEELQQKDPQIIVIDEVLGQMLAFVGGNLDSVWTYGAALGLFRLFDIWKPFPVGLFEKLPGGAGVICDDLMAGLYAAFVMYVLRNFVLLPL